MSTQDTSNGRRDYADKRPATIYDIARLANVNPSTVSRALNKPGRTSPDTERRIREAADAVGYRINPMARALPTGRTGMIAVLLSDFTNPFYFDLVRAAEHLASESGLALILAESQESMEREFDTAERLLPSVDGLILVATRLSDERIADIASRKSLVVVNREVSGVPSVVAEVAPGIREAVSHLNSLGHRSLAYIAGPTASWMSGRRCETVFAEARRHGLHIVEIGPNDPTMEGGRETLERVLASGVSAAVVYNDLMAIGLLRACQAAGIAVPEQLSIVGFDDIFGSDLTTPAITTVRSPVSQLGEAAVRLLAPQEAGLATEQPALSTELLVRGSTGRARTDF